MILIPFVSRGSRCRAVIALCGLLAALPLSAFAAESSGLRPKAKSLCAVVSDAPMQAPKTSPVPELGAKPIPGPATSAGKAAPANANIQTSEIPKDLAGETAARVRARALFAADAAPEAASAVLQSPRASQKAGLTPEKVINILWLLRSDKSQVKAWLGALNAPTEDKDAVFREFAALPRELRALTRALGGDERRVLAAKARETRADMRGLDREQRGHAVSRMLLDRRGVEDDLLARAVAVHAALKRENIDAAAAGPYLHALAQLMENPDDLQLAASLLKTDVLEGPAKHALMAKLLTAPSAARSQIAGLSATASLQNAYSFVMREEGACDIIKMPLDTILPEAVRPVSRPRTIPLATYWMRPKSQLSFKRLGALFPAKGESGNSAGSILLPGERLYAVGSGFSVYEGTPLDSLSISGPAIFEYDPARFPSGNVYPTGSGNTRPFLIAAVCGPEDLAKHLASLSVMQTAREKSLYGPFEDFAWAPQDTPRGLYHKNLATLPKDVPGKALRLVDVTDPDLFLAFAPNADKPGLARFMGPIRAVWTLDKSSKEQPWTELRYNPGRRGPKQPSILGESPLLSVDKEALAAIVALKEQEILYAWAAYALRNGCGDDIDKPQCWEQWPSALDTMRKTFADLGRQGIVSPWDKGGMVYLLERHAKNPTLVETMKLMRDDKSQSSAKRRRAMEAAAKK